MSVKNITQAYDKAALTLALQQQLEQSEQQMLIPHLEGSSLSFFVNSVFKKATQHFLLVFKDKEEAAYYLNDLEQLISKDTLLFFPGSYRRPYQIEETDNINILLRMSYIAKPTDKMLFSKFYGLAL